MNQNNIKKRIKTNLEKSILIFLLCISFTISNPFHFERTYAMAYNEEQEKIDDINKQGKEYIENIVQYIINETEKQKEINSRPVIVEPTYQDVSYLITSIASNETKSWMDYRAVTSETSAQWNVLNNLCVVGDDGLLRYEGKYIAIATGSKLGPVGTKYRVTFANGQTHYFIKGDAKADVDTSKEGGVHGLAHPGGSVIEFVIDKPIANYSYSEAIYDGDFDSIEIFKGKIIKFEIEV